MTGAGKNRCASKRLGSPYRSGWYKDWLKFKNPAAPAVKREAEEDWGTRAVTDCCRSGGTRAATSSAPAAPAPQRIDENQHRTGRHRAPRLAARTGLSIHRSPVGVIRRLPVTVKRLAIEPACAVPRRTVIAVTYEPQPGDAAAERCALLGDGHDRVRIFASRAGLSCTTPQKTSAPSSKRYLTRGSASTYLMLSIS
jgi:hypothetical protein